MPTQVGRRIYPHENPVHDCHPEAPCDDPPVEVFGPFAPGDYGGRLMYRDRPLHWECYPPGGNLGSLTDHDITVHEDDTITVSPSILELGPDDVEVWHGYLERGVWRW